MNDDSQQPPEDSDPSSTSGDARTRSADLHAVARANEDATWGDTDSGKAIVPGIISGDLGPKGKVAAQLRGLSRTERSTYGQVPRGTVVPGGGRYIFAMMAGIVLALAAVVALIGWLAS